MRNALVIKMVFQFQCSHDDKHKVCDLQEVKYAFLFGSRSQLSGTFLPFFPRPVYYIVDPVVESRFGCFFSYIFISLLYVCLRMWQLFIWNTQPSVNNFKCILLWLEKTTCEHSDLISRFHYRSLSFYTILAFSAGGHCIRCFALNRMVL